jgi:hypothetical protein
MGRRGLLLKEEVTKDRQEGRKLSGKPAGDAVTNTGTLNKLWWSTA